MTLLVRLWQAIVRGYLRLVAPVADALVRWGVSPNTITVIGTSCCLITGALFAAGWIRTGGWFLGITALWDVLDGQVARRTGRATVFGAFFDSTLDRVADTGLYGGLALFFSRLGPLHSPVMVGWCLAALAGAFVTSYTRARGEALGVDLKTGWLQRPERITLLAAPQAFFGTSFDGWVLRGVVVLLAVTAWVTVLQRFRAMRAFTESTSS
jgi:CDP-diacylglycerol--glycerol-3-phosphate 3-phosphatidyltransferase